MPRYVKLTEPGEQISIVVTDVKFDGQGKWPDWKIRGDTAEGEDVVVTIPVAAAKRQLDTMGVENAEAEADAERVKAKLMGRGVVVMRSTKTGANGKPFWDMGWDQKAGTPKPDRVKPSQSGGTGPLPKQAQAQVEAAQGRNEQARKWLAAAYGQLMTDVKSFLPVQDNATLQQATATVWIQAGRDGFLTPPPEVLMATTPAAARQAEETAEFGDEPLGDDPFNDDLPFD